MSRGAVAACLAVLLAIAMGCARDSGPQVEALLSWSPAAMGEIEPQIRRQFERALALLASRVERHASDPDLAEAVGQLGMLHHVYQNTEPALAAYRLAESLAPTEPRWPYYRGYLLAKTGEPEAAIRAYRAATEVAGDLQPIRLRLAEAQTRSGDLTGAAESLGRLSPEARRSARALAASGELALARGEFERAVELFERARDLQPESNRLRVGLGQALRESGRMEEAREVLADAGAVTPQDAELGFTDPLLAELYKNNVSSQGLWEVGQILLREGHAEEALVYFRRATEIVPDRESYRTDVANALAAMDRLDTAVLEYEAVLEEHPSYLPALAGLAKTQTSLPDHAAAMRTYRRLLDVDEGHADIHLALADLLRVTGDAPAAEAHYQRALDLDPTSSSASVWLAWLRFEEGRPAESLDLLQQARVIHPENAWMASLEMRIRASQRDAGIPSDLRRDAARLVERNPTAFNAETLAMVYAGQGDFESSRRWQKAVVEAAQALGLNTELMGRRLGSYDQGRLPREILSRADLESSRLPLKRADFEELAPSLKSAAE